MIEPLAQPTLGPFEEGSLEAGTAVRPPLRLVGDETDLGRPAGEVHNTPALLPPRPALKSILATLPQALRGRVGIARQHLPKSAPAADDLLPTAQPLLDRLLAGGLARGTLTELVGRSSSGRFSVVLGLLAAATSAGEAAALIDLGDSLDPRSAAASGVELPRLLWLRPQRLKTAWMAAEAVIVSGFACVVLDLGLPPLVGNRGSEGPWLRLARVAQAHGASLLVSSPYRTSGPAATAVLSLAREGARWRGVNGAPRLLAGLDGELSLAKHRGRSPGDHGPLRLRIGAMEVASLRDAHPPEEIPRLRAFGPALGMTSRTGGQIPSDVIPTGVCAAGVAEGSPTPRSRSRGGRWRVHAGALSRMALGVRD